MSEQSTPVDQNPSTQVKLVMTRPAVEALLGAQPELKVQLTQQVADQIVSKHVLKSIIGNQQINALVSDLRAVASAEIVRQVGTIKRDWTGQVTECKLNSEVEEKIKSLVVARVDELASRLVTEKIDKKMAELDSIIDRQLALIVPDVVRAKVQAAVKKVAESL